jgi:deoxyribonuclease-4
MATAEPAMFKKSVHAFVDELERCEALGLASLVTHPGSPGEAGEEVGIRRCRRGSTTRSGARRATR